MALHLPPPVKAVIGIVIDDGINLGRRIEAAELLMQHNLPGPVVSAARKFLCEIAEDKAGFPGHRLAAAKAVLRRDVGKLELREGLTAAELVADGLRRTEERDRQLRLVSSTEPPAEPEPKAG
jgi:hypothetical protein